jgi:uncharacterized membrane protein HdeD (DUF308 family)
MNTVSRTISGVIAFLVGLFVIIVTLSERLDPWSMVWGLGWGATVAGVGIYLFFNKKEDEIEEIKNNQK